MNKLDNQENRDKFPEIHQLQRLNQKKAENPNRSVINIENELVTKNIPSQKTPRNSFLHLPILLNIILQLMLPSSSVSKSSACNAGDPGLIPGSGRSPGEGNGNPLQYSCWKIPWTEEPGRLQSMGLEGVGLDLVTKPPQ